MLLEPAPEVIATCPRCGGSHRQRWTVDLRRPAVAWSTCAGCGWIAVWAEGRLERPVEVAGEPICPQAIDAMVQGAREAQARMQAELAHLRAESAAIAEAMERRRGFIERLRCYQQEGQHQTAAD